MRRQHQPAEGAEAADTAPEAPTARFRRPSWRDLDQGRDQVCQQQHGRRNLADRRLGAVSGCLGAFCRLMLATHDPAAGGWRLNLIGFTVVANVIFALLGGGVMGWMRRMPWQAHIGASWPALPSARPGGHRSGVTILKTRRCSPRTPRYMTVGATPPRAA